MQMYTLVLIAAFVGSSVVAQSPPNRAQVIGEFEKLQRVMDTMKTDYHKLTNKYVALADKHVALIKKSKTLCPCSAVKKDCSAEVQKKEDEIYGNLDAMCHFTALLKVASNSISSGQSIISNPGVTTNVETVQTPGQYVIAQPLKK